MSGPYPEVDDEVRSECAVLDELQLVPDTHVVLVEGRESIQDIPWERKQTHRVSTDGSHRLVKRRSIY